MICRRMSDIGERQLPGTAAIGKPDIRPDPFRTRIKECTLASFEQPRGVSSIRMR